MIKLFNPGAINLIREKGDSDKDWELALFNAIALVSYDFFAPEGCPKFEDTEFIRTGPQKEATPNSCWGRVNDPVCGECKAFSRR